MSDKENFEYYVVEEFLRKKNFTKTLNQFLEEKEEKNINYLNKNILSPLEFNQNETILNQLIKKIDKNENKNNLLNSKENDNNNINNYEKISYLGDSIVNSNNKIDDNVNLDSEISDLRKEIKKNNNDDDNDDNDDYNNKIKNHEHDGEKSIRCYLCYELRLEKTCVKAKELGFDFFTTTLSISPYKISKWINEIGYNLQNKYNVNYLYSDFKKEEGYKKSIELSCKYNMYRQDYCGCKYSKEERDKIKNDRIKEENDN
jgi:predicted adenine nucleotide alpha hydrolase (AANH) superfamily ATPase